MSGMAVPAALRHLFVCPIREYLGWLCPGCGGTHAVIALLHGHFGQAWQSNALLLLLLPLGMLYVMLLLGRVWRGRPDPFPPVPPAVVYLLVTAATVFTVARNLPY